MTGIFSTEGGIYHFMTRLYQIMLLNILFILSCLPIVTIGAAVSSSYGTAFKMLEYKEKAIYKEFFMRFKRDFIPATVIWLGVLVTAVSCYALGPVLQTVIAGNKLIYFLVMLLLTIAALTVLYSFPLIARFENTIGSTMINALVLSLRHLAQSILIFLVTALLLVLPILVPKLFFGWLFLGWGLIFYVTARIFHSVFKKYEHKEDGK